MKQFRTEAPPQKIMDNRVTHYNGINYYYDKLGNIICREADGLIQNLYYDVFHQLIKIETLTKISENNWEKDTWEYLYDALGRRVQKARINADGKEENITEFLWDGTRLFQEIYANGRYTYIYADQNSYEPLAQVHNWTDEEGASHETICYFHCDQAGSPREMTDKDGNLLWYGDYQAWGKLKSETHTGAYIHQPFRLQGQYYDPESGLHYNLNRYYDPNFGRFMTQDPIGLAGGSNAYFAFPNAQMWHDPLGLTGTYILGNAAGGCYVGKGGEQRVQTSIRQRFPNAQSGDVSIDPKTLKPTVCIHQDFTQSPFPDRANEIGLMVEAKLMDKVNALQKVEKGGCFNKINSFGARLLSDNLSDKQRQRYKVTDVHRNYAKKQAEKMYQDFLVGKCSPNCLKK